MKIIQIRLKPNVEEGERSGYNNYEFGMLTGNTDWTGRPEANFYGPDRQYIRYHGSSQQEPVAYHRMAYSICKHEYKEIIETED